MLLYTNFENPNYILIAVVIITGGTDSVKIWLNIGIFLTVIKLVVWRGPTQSLNIFLLYSPLARLGRSDRC